MYLRIIHDRVQKKPVSKDLKINEKNKIKNKTIMKANLKLLKFRQIALDIPTEK